MGRANCLVVAAIGVLATPSYGQTSSEHPLSWMQGCWQGSRGSVVFREHWMPPAGGMMLGMSRTTRDDKAVAHEFMRIDAIDGKFAFTAKPSSKPEATFRQIALEAKQITFENAEKDFPQRIVYRLDAEGGLVGRIEGSMNGTPRAIDFPMKRIACD